jgi:hypothetical protein
MPNGTLDSTRLYNASVRKDRAGAYTDPNGVYHPQGESPTQMSGIQLVAGEFLNFDAIAGTGQHGATQLVVGPDGDTNRIFEAYSGAHFGKSNIFAPIDSVVGVFLGDTSPAGDTPPATLDFTSAASRDYTTLSPMLNQVFFIGDGLKSDGTQQSFKVPAGATRLFIGKMDGTEWNNNIGTSTVTVHRPQQRKLVR